MALISLLFYKTEFYFYSVKFIVYKTHTHTHTHTHTQTLFLLIIFVNITYKISY